MAAPSFVSYAQNGEDVVLWRALRGVPGGRYVDVGANSPDEDSVTKAFYERGWTGVHVEPVPEFAGRLREARPRDTVVEAAVVRDPGAVGGQAELHELVGTGLSTLQADLAARHETAGFDRRRVTVPATSLAAIVEEHADGPVHFLKVDVEGAEAEVLASVDLRSWRPWVVLVESTVPNSTAQTHAEWEGELLAAGYRFCLFDGLSRFYVADEHADELAPSLSYPAGPLDDFVPLPLAEARRAAAEARRVAEEAGREAERIRRAHADVTAEVEQLRRELVRWRGAVLDRWTRAAAGVDASAPARPDGEAEHLRAELERMRSTVSWRVTRPLRTVRARSLARSGR